MICKYFSLATLFVLLFFQPLIAQSQFRGIDPKWDKYYKDNPSGIENDYKATTFIRIANLVGFVAKNYDNKNFQKALLTLTEDDLDQMRMTGSYYSRTIKHDDYFALYNLTYKEITKKDWDLYCPYLLPLMSADGTISLK